MSKLPRPMHALSFASLTALGAFGLLGACSDGNPCGDEVATRVDDEGDFDAYATFAVIDVPDDIGAGGAGGAGGGFGMPDDIRVNLEIANEAAATQLELLGLERVEADEDPDLFVLSASAAQEETGIYWTCVPDWYWWGWYYYWDPCAWMAPIPVEYTVGSLLIATVDAKTEEPVFGGVVQGLLECTSEDLEDRIEDGVETIFDDYPN